MEPWDGLRTSSPTDCERETTAKREERERESQKGKRGSEKKEVGDQTIPSTAIPKAAEQIVGAGAEIPPMVK